MRVWEGSVRQREWGAWDGVGRGCGMGASGRGLWEGDMEHMVWDMGAWDRDVWDTACRQGAVGDEVLIPLFLCFWWLLYSPQLRL